MSDKDGHEYFECTCHSDEHLLRFTYFGANEDDEAELYANVFLDTPGFWKRLWIGLKYIAGYKCKYGHFGTWEMSPENIVRLQALLDKYRRSNIEHT